MSKFGKNHSKAAKLTGTQVMEIRARYLEGETQGSLCREFNVGIAQIGKIVRGEAWKGLPTPQRLATDAELNEGAERLVKLSAEVIRKEIEAQTPGINRLDTETEKAFKPQKDLDKFIKGEEK